MSLPLGSTCKPPCCIFVGLLGSHRGWEKGSGGANQAKCWNRLCTCTLDLLLVIGHALPIFLFIFIFGLGQSDSMLPIQALFQATLQHEDPVCYHAQGSTCAVDSSVCAKYKCIRNGLLSDNKSHSHLLVIS